MTAEEEIFKKVATEFFYHWWNTEGNNTSYGFDMWWEEKGKQLVKDYHKESSKELVEALKSVTEGYKHYSTLLNKHDWKRIHEAEKALENHLKTTNPH